MNSKLKNKVVIISGGASGIGAAASLLFAKEGALVVIADLQVSLGEELVKKIQSFDGKAYFIKCDVTSETDIQNMVLKTIEKYGGLDCAFNNAGIEGESADTVQCTLANWDSVINTNLKGIWLCMKYQIPEILKAGGGNIVNCSSIAGLVGFEGSPAYTASKHGVIGLTKAAALEYARNNLRINAICPGVIETPMIERFTHGDEEKMNALRGSEPIGRLGRAEEVARAALWLCSDDSSFVTGHPLVIDGGWIAR